MSPGRVDPHPGGPGGTDPTAALKLLRTVASMAAALLVMALIGLAFAPKDGGTVTLYSLVIGLNLLILLLYWPVSRWLRHLPR